MIGGEETVVTPEYFLLRLGKYLIMCPFPSLNLRRKMNEEFELYGKFERYNLTAYILTLAKGLNCLFLWALVLLPKAN